MSWNVVRYDMLTAAEFEVILSYYKLHTAADTLNHFNISRATLDKILKDTNIQPHTTAISNTLRHFKIDNYDKLTEIDFSNIINEYKQIGTVEEVCFKLKIKSYLLIYLLEQAGLPIIHSKQESSIVKHDQQLQSADQTAIIDFYLIPHTLEETMKTFGITKSVLKNILKNNNVSLHDPAITNKLSRQKAIKSIEEKYGYTNVFQVEEIKQKSKSTKLDKYGTATYTNREKAKETCLEKYGADTYLSSNQGQQMIKDNSQKLYGTDYAFQSKLFQGNQEIKAKRYNTIKNNKYTIENYSDLYLTVATDCNKFTNFIQGKTVNQIMQELSISRDHTYYLLSKYNLIDNYQRDFTGSSIYEDELVNFIGESLCIRHNRTILDGQEIDIFIPSKNIAIEFNGTYWHSTLNQPNKKYHFNKSLLAEKKGIRLMHIYEYEWEDPIQREKIKLMLNIALGRVKHKIYARQCEIKQISNKEAAVLNNKIHLQGHRNAQVTYGLFYNNELVQLMSFSHTKYNKNLKTENSWEIIRGCPGSNNIVVGGVSKILSHFIADYKPNKIFSYCDFNKFDGNSYFKAGMNFIGYTGPDMKWVLKDGRVVNRCPEKHTELKETATAQIFGAGSKKFELIL